MPLPPDFKPDKDTVQWAMERIRDLIESRRHHHKGQDVGTNGIAVVPHFLYQQFLKATRQTTRKAPTDGRA